MATQATTNQWDVRKSTGLVLQTDGTWFVREERLTPVDPRPIMQDVLKEQGWLSPMLSPGTFVFFSTNTTILMQILSNVPFKVDMVVDTQSTEDSDGKQRKTAVYLPAFNKAGIAVEPAFTYVPPKATRLVLTVDVLCNEVPHLLMQDVKDGKMYHPIVPNIYETGRMCVGDRFQRPLYKSTIGLEAYLKEFLTEWSNTKWNNDLYGSGGGDPRGWLRFDEETKQNILPKEEDAWKAFTGTPIVPSLDTDRAMHSLHTFLTGGKG